MELKISPKNMQRENEGRASSVGCMNPSWHTKYIQIIFMLLITFLQHAHWSGYIVLIECVITIMIIYMNPGSATKASRTLIIISSKWCVTWRARQAVLRFDHPSVRIEGSSWTRVLVFGRSPGRAVMTHRTLKTLWLRGIASARAIKTDQTKQQWYNLAATGGNQAERANVCIYTCKHSKRKKK